MRRTYESSFSMRAMALVQLAAGRECVGDEGLGSAEVVVVDDGHRKPELGRSLLTEGFDCSLDSVAYAPLGDSSLNEGDVGGNSRDRDQEGDRGAGVCGGDADDNGSADPGRSSKMPASGLRRGEVVGERPEPVDTVRSRLWGCSDASVLPLGSDCTFSALVVSKGAKGPKGIAALERPTLAGEARVGEADLRRLFVF